MRLLALSCEVLARLVYGAAATSPHIVDIHLVPKKMHDDPEKLQEHLSALLSEVDPEKYDAVILGYGLCSNAIVGLTAPVKLIVPRAHDCITLFLGDRMRYAAEFREHPGTYWYAPDYMERNNADGASLGMGSSSDEAMQQQYAVYVEKYGRDNADYLMEVMGAWRDHYERAAYVCIQDVSMPDYTDQIKQVATRRKWTYVEVEGHAILVRRLVHGDWDNNSFLILEPGQSISPSFDSRVVMCSETGVNNEPINC